MKNYSILQVRGIKLDKGKKIGRRDIMIKIASWFFKVKNNRTVGISIFFSHSMVFV